MAVSDNMERSGGQVPGGFSGFWSWWWDRLAGLLQRALPGDRRRHVILREEGSVLTLRLSTGRNTPLPPISLQQSNQVIAAQLRSQLKQLRAIQTPIIGRLPRDHALQRVVTLPRAAETNPRAVLLHQIDRLTPWPSSHCSFDIEALGYSPDGKSLQLRLTAASKISVTNLYQRLTAWGLRPSAIDAEGLESTSGHQVNLLSHDTEALRRPKRLLNTLALGTLLVLLGLTAFQTVEFLEERERAQSLEARLAELEPARRETRVLAERVSALRQESSYLSRKKLQEPSVTLLIERLSLLLPQGVWLEQLRYEDDRLFLVGNAERASDLIALIESSPHFSAAAFTASTRRDAQSGKERFQIAADIITNPADPKAAEVEPEGSKP